MGAGAERMLRVGSAAVIGALAALVLVAVSVGSVATNTSLLMSVVEDSALYRLGLSALAADLEDADVVVRLNTGPLELTREGVEAILRDHFTPEDVGLKAGEVHADLVDYVRAYPRDSIFRVSIRRERPILLRGAERTILEGFRSLPDCGLATDLGILGRAGRWRLFGDGSGETFLESLPACRPPGPVADRVVEGIRAEVARMLVSGADTVEAFPDPATTDWTTYSRLMHRLQAADRLLSRSTWMWLVGVAVVLAAAWGFGGRTPWLPGGWPVLTALGTGLLLAGLALRAGDLPAVTLTAFGGEADPGGEVRRLWLRLGAYSVERVLRSVSAGCLLVGAVLGAFGLLGVGAAGGFRTKGGRS